MFGVFIQIRILVTSHIFELENSLDVLEVLLLPLVFHQKLHLLIEDHDLECELLVVLLGLETGVKGLVDHCKAFDDLLSGLEALDLLHGGLDLLFYSVDHT